MYSSFNKILIPAISLLFLASFYSLSAEIIEIPELKTRVTDLTGTLSSKEISSIELKLESLEKQKGSQVGVLILPTTGDETIEQFGIRLAENWKLGRKGIDDGAILIVAKDDRKLRIEVGYGLEGSLTDVLSFRIIEDIITPHFKSREFFQGVDAGVDAIITVISGEELPLPEKTYEEDEFDTNKVTTIFITFLIIGVLIRQIFGIAAAFIGTGILAFLVSLIFLPLLLSVGLAVVVALIAATAGSGTGGGGSYSSGSGGFSSGGSSGGFSGGGGGFGGGGASGSW